MYQIALYLFLLILVLTVWYTLDRLTAATNGERHYRELADKLQSQLDACKSYTLSASAPNAVKVEADRLFEIMKSSDEALNRAIMVEQELISLNAQVHSYLNDPLCDDRAIRQQVRDQLAAHRNHRNHLR